MKVTWLFQRSATTMNVNDKPFRRHVVVTGTNFHNMKIIGGRQQ